MATVTSTHHNPGMWLRADGGTVSEDLAAPRAAALSSPDGYRTGQRQACTGQQVPHQCQCPCWEQGLWHQDEHMGTAVTR